MNATEKPPPEFLENEEMWTQRAIDTPDEVLDELASLQENQQLINASKQSSSTKNKT